eukprot:6180326-Pleurochrysis_carterae.AAC.1
MNWEDRRGWLQLEYCCQAKRSRHAASTSCCHQVPQQSITIARMCGRSFIIAHRFMHQNRKGVV